MNRFLGLAFLLILSLSVQAGVDTARFIQLIDYIAVDYRDAVADGQVVNMAEYEEMREFATTVVEQATLLDPRSGSMIVDKAQHLLQLIQQRAEPDRVATSAALLRQDVLQRYPVNTVPRHVPDLQAAKKLFSDNCASCHGLQGHGDGVLSAGMEPAPTDFHDAARYRARTLFGLYSTISLGVEGTSMQSYGQVLSEAERWSLAFYVGQMAISDQQRQQGKTIYNEAGKHALADLAVMTTVTPAEAVQRFGADSADLMAYLRSEPAVMFNDKDALGFTRQQIHTTLQLYAKGDQKAAYKSALSAYLDGFELIEQHVDTVDSALRLDIETAMTQLREMIRAGQSQADVENHAQATLALIDKVASALSSHSLSSGAAFTSSFIILIREGLEALLVIAALAAFLIKTDRRDGLIYIHIGWIAALTGGAATWLASQYLFDFSGASREITEGIAALVAMAVLFYVGFWLHNKTTALQWKRFIEGAINKALDSGTLWALAGLSFIAVYREVFETILFYQAIWVQADKAAQGSMFAGMLTAAGLLVLLAWLILRYSTRLPLRQFFAFTSVFMFALAVIFAGKGVAALQEAGKLSVYPVNFPRIDMLGIYPNLEGLLLQGVLIIIAAIILFDVGRRNRVSTS